MKSLMVANWKMNPATQKEAKALFNAVKAAFAKASASQRKSEVVICPPFVYLALLKGPTLSLSKGLSLGAQNIFWEDKGAFTGEISASQLKDLKIEYVIIGHSERRKYFHETDEVINKKLKKALDANLTPIFCIGENEGEDKSMVLEKQITDGLKGLSREQAKALVIAYEPVWAIGTGNNCSVDQTLSSVLLIRKLITNLYSREIADNMRILYGGSVNSKNSGSYIKEARVNGLLVGGASLDAHEFLEIVKSAE